MKYLINFLAVIYWIAGIVIAKGFWSTFFAIIFPLWAYYLLLERLIQQYLPS